MRYGLLLLASFALAGQEASPFLSVPKAAEDSLRFGAPLPAFEARDVAGRVWRLDDLRGKYTLIYTWHTFEARAADSHEGRVRETVWGFPDLREVQRFYDKMKGKNTVQVLTFCTDYDYTHARDYMRETGLTFPVIADWALARKISPQGIPRYAVVDPEGRLSLPFRSWSFGRLLFELDALAARN